METLTIINSAKKRCEFVEESDCYRSKKAGDAMQKIEEVCRENPETRIVMYGGDGSVYEAVNAIMNAGTQDKTELTIVPFGTGNDFVKTLNEEEDERLKIDLIKFNDKYCANIINMGFDCDVVDNTEKLKRKGLVKGSFSYIFGVIVTLFQKMGKHFDIEFTLEDGTVETEKGEHLLCLVANGKYYGGGFKAAPLADLRSGLLDVLLVRKISRFRFASFIGGYKKGLHILPDGSVNPKYASIAVFKKCVAVNFKGVGRVCADGEIIDCQDAYVSVVPKALTIVKDRT